MVTKVRQIEKGPYDERYKVTGSNLSDVLNRTAVLVQALQPEDVTLFHDVSSKGKHRVIVRIFFEE